MPRIDFANVRVMPRRPCNWTSARARRRISMKRLYIIRYVGISFSSAFMIPRRRGESSLWSFNSVCMCTCGWEWKKLHCIIPMGFVCWKKKKTRTGLRVLSSLRHQSRRLIKKLPCFGHLQSGDYTSDFPRNFQFWFDRIRSFYYLESESVKKCSVEKHDVCG